MKFQYEHHFINNEGIHVIINDGQYGCCITYNNGIFSTYGGDDSEYKAWIDAAYDFVLHWLQSNLYIT